VANAGADPAEVDEAWLEAFSDSLFEQLNYDMQLIGGDTTRGPLSMTLGIHGYVPGRALKRGAKPGDWIYVTGTPGTAPPGWRFCRIGCRWMTH
jgi:thiamine-monophosphate kinase